MNEREKFIKNHCDNKLNFNPKCPINFPLHAYIITCNSSSHHNNQKQTIFFSQKSLFLTMKNYPEFQLQFSPEDISKYKEAFSLFDTDGDGHISTKDLQIVLKKLGQAPSEAELLDLVLQNDINGSGTVTFYEFLVAIARLASDEGDHETEEEYRQAFKVFDKDGDGLISAEELKHGMAKLGDKLTDKEVKELIREADMDNDGHLNYEEFRKLMAR